MVQQVEGFCAKPKGYTVVQWNIAPDGEIQLRFAEAAQLITWSIPKIPCWRKNESSGIDGLSAGILRAVQIERLSRHDVQCARVFGSRCWIDGECTAQGYGKCGSNIQASIQCPNIQHLLNKVSGRNLGQFPTHPGLKIIPNIKVGVCSLQWENGCVRAEVNSVRPGIGNECLNPLCNR